jgi:Ca2+-binding RTX toxin-like protein
MSAQHPSKMTPDDRVATGRGPSHPPLARPSATAVTRAARRTVAELLETRRMFAVEITDGFLLVTGTNGDDEIIISIDADDRNSLIIDDNGQRHAFDVRQIGFDIRGIQVAAGPGADLVEVDQKNGSIKAAFVFFGGSGDDTLIGGGGHDAIYGQGQSDLIRGNSGDDRLDGGGDNDTITGDRGEDRIIGRDGDDSIRGRAGDDVIDGGDGFDTLNGGSGADLIDGGNDEDLIDGGAGNDTIDGGNGDDEIDGNRGRDYIFGGDGDDFLRGGSGADQLWGRRGRDSLEGGGGEDSLDGGDGNDSLFGDIHGDTFSIRIGDRRSDIEDFNAAEGDQIARFEDESVIIRGLRKLRRR